MEKSPTTSSKPAKFIAAPKFKGKKPGYFFKKGSKGVGYYLDKRQAPPPAEKKKKKKRDRAVEPEEEVAAKKNKSETKKNKNETEKTQNEAAEKDDEEDDERVIEVKRTEEPQEKATFASLGVVPELQESCTTIGWEFATPIQREAIPNALAGRDLIALAETGSGKTGAFSIPILQGLLNNQQRLYAAILAPTRELANQIHEVISALGAPIGAKCACVVGGIDIVTQQISLAKKPHIVIATPGRLVDHLENTKGFNLRALKVLVLDEADQMLSLDFEEVLNKLLQVLPRERNTYLFSATMTSKVAKLQRASLRDPVKVSVSDSKYQTVQTLNQQYLFIPAKYKDCYLVYILNELAGQSALIFTSTCAHTQKATLMLRNLGFEAICLHGQMSQPKRVGALRKFKSGERTILVATDVASRGLDIPSVDLVVNYDVPSNGKIYVHRVGRTARAGKSGRAITLVTQYDVEVYTRIETMLEKKLDAFPAEKETVLVMYERVFEAQRVAALEWREMGMGKKGRRDGDDDDRDEGSLVNRMIEQNFKNKNKKFGGGKKFGGSKKFGGNNKPRRR